MPSVTQETAMSERLEIRLPPTLLVRLNLAADAYSLSLSAYVRDRLTHAVRRDLSQASREK